MVAVEVARGRTPIRPPRPGVGAAAVRSIVVEWPSGLRTERSDPATSGVLQIKEEGDPEEPPSPES